MAQWADVTERRLSTSKLPWETGPIERGIDLLRTLPISASQRVLLHGDLHPGNILATEREPWLVIDPKPMAGDPAYEPIQLLTQERGRIVEPPDPSVIVSRMDDLADKLDLDAKRIGQWALARSAEWSMWSYDHGAIVDAAIEYSWARVLSRLVSE
jgi:streptomycin 6-kinase